MAGFHVTVEDGSLRLRHSCGHELDAGVEGLTGVELMRYLRGHRRECTEPIVLESGDVFAAPVAER